MCKHSKAHFKTGPQSIVASSDVKDDRATLLSDDAKGTKTLKKSGS